MLRVRTVVATKIGRWTGAHTPRRRSFALWLLGVCACGAEAETQRYGGAEDAIGASREALGDTDTGTIVAPQCDEAALVSATCAGPWQYHPWAVCGVGVSAPAATCLGTGVRQTEAHSFETERTFPSPSATFDACEGAAEHMEPTLAALRGGLAPEYQPSVRVASSVSRVTGTYARPEPCPAVGPGPGGFLGGLIDRLRSAAGTACQTYTVRGACDVVLEYTAPASRTCKTWNTCQDWAFGAGATQTEARSFDATPSRQEGSPAYFDACATMATVMQPHLDALRAKVPAAFQDRVQIASGTTRVTSVYTTEENCGFLGLFCDDYYHVNAACDVVLQYPTPGAGAASVCGCAEWQCQAPACGAQASSLTSRSGLTAATLPVEDAYAASAPAPICTTCDPLPIDTAAAVQAKFRCLQDHQRDTSPEVRAQIDARLRVLLTLKADQLTAQQRQQAWQAFSRGARGSSLGCESDVAVSMPGACPADTADGVARDLAACERLAAAPDGPSQARVAWVTADTCVDLVATMDGLQDAGGERGSCFTQALADRALGAATRLVEQAIAGFELRLGLGGAEQVSAAQYPDLDRTLRLLDRWATARGNTRGVVSEADAPADDAFDGMVSRFWSAAHRMRETTAPTQDLISAGTGSEADFAAALAQTAARAARLDRDVLRSAHRNQGTLPAVETAGIEVMPAVSILSSLTSGDLLLRLTGESLTGLSLELAHLAPFHDLACHLAGCGPRALTRTLERTELSNLWGVLASLDRTVDTPTGESLATVLARLPNDSAWRPPFLALQANQQALRSAVTRALAPGADGKALAADAPALTLDALDPTRLRPSLVPLTAMAGEARQRALNFRASGLLSGPGSRRLHANVSPAGRTATLAAFEAALTTFAADIATYQTDRRTAVTDAISAANAERAFEAGQQRLRELDTQLARLNGDAEGLSASLLRLDQGVGTVAAQLASLEGSLDSGAFLEVGDTQRFEIHGYAGSNATAIEARPTPVEQFAAQYVGVWGTSSTSVSARANQLVTVQATGEYSPLCSLTRQGGVSAGLFGNSTLSVVPYPGTTVGPEGFNLEQSGSSTIAKSREKQKSGGLGGFLGAVGAVFSGFGGVGSAIGGVLSGLGSLAPRDVTRSGSSASVTDSVRFHGGLRLPDTPFPDLPAGALLLVELPQGARDSGSIRAIHLVQRGTTSFITSADVDLYFVVNDHWVKEDCERISPPSDPNGVTVQLQLSTPTTDIAERAIVDLQQVTNWIRSQRTQVLAQGRTSGPQLAQMGVEARLRLQTLLGVDVTTLPGALREFIQAQVDRELSATELAVARLTLERQAADVLLEAAAVHTEIDSLRTSTRDAGLLPVWRLRTWDEFNDGVDERSLTDSAQTLVDRASETLLPILELWHPAALRAARNQLEFRRDAQALANIGLGADPVSFVDEVERMLQRLRTAYESDPTTHLDPLNQPIVAVSFGRPRSWSPPCPYCPENSTSGLPAASEARARAVWRAIEAALRRTEPVASRTCGSDADCVQPGTYCPLSTSLLRRCVRAPTTVDFGLEVADVYRFSGGQGALLCSLASPVVQQWGLLFANQTDDYDDELLRLSKSGRILQVRAQPRQRFVTETGVLDYEMTDQPSLASGISLLYGSDESAFSTFQSLANDRLLAGRNPVGLSAFANLTLDFAPLANMRHTYGNGIGESSDRPVTELILFMRLDAREFSAALPGHELEGIVSTCSPDW